MSRRGTNRRHILDISSNGSSSPKANWQGSQYASRDVSSKMNEFLKEIGELESGDSNSQVTLPEISPKEMENPWQECFDETTGCPYYWNTNTNAVVWEMPADYKAPTPVNTVKLNIKSPSAPRVSKFDIPPIAPVNSSASRSTLTQKPSLSSIKKPRYPHSDSEDEKIELITSYGEDSESEEEISSVKVPEKTELPKVPVCSSTIYRIQPESQVIPPSNSELLDYNLQAPPQVGIQALVKKFETEKPKPEPEDDDLVILNELRKQAKVLQELGGEVPRDVENLIKPDEPKVDDIIAQIEQEKPPDLKPNPLISLVAGYGDDSDVEDEEEVMEPPPIKSIFPILAENCEPIVTEPIEKIENEPPPEDFDTKLFKRKRRIALDVLPKKIIKVEESSNENRLGFGFEPSNEKNDSKAKYGGMFIKAETINLPLVDVTTNGDEDKPIEGLMEMADLVKEKVHFLIEGKEDVSAEQIMAIQLNTLLEAYQSKGLSSRYLFDWLKETTTEINKLEQEAVPNGWFCQWDRSNKRYFYRNQLTGRTQWEYPTAQQCTEENLGAEAMDICTTPPPPPDETEPVPPPLPKEERPKTPPPPTIRLKSPTPPPPPTISTDIEGIPSPSCNEQPLPPGVDSPETPYIQTDKPADKSLGSELESFYSDIASLEPIPVGPLPTAEIIDKATTEKLISEVKKKKKKTTKIGSGLTLKKKEVSALVEKWKKVQNDF